jgi:CBS domain-containing protein
MLDQQVSALIPPRKGVDHVTAEQTVLEAIRYMKDVRRGAVPVISGTRLVGMFSERDLMLRVVLAGRDAANTRVEDVMSRELVVAQSSDLCRDCMNKMKQMHFRHLPVVEAGQLVGILSLRDLMEAEAEGRAREIEMLNYYVSYGG